MDAKSYLVIRNDYLSTVAKENNVGTHFRPRVNYVTGLIACTIPRKSILSKIAYTCEKREMNREKINRTVQYMNI